MPIDRSPAFSGQGSFGLSHWSFGHSCSLRHAEFQTAQVTYTDDAATARAVVGSISNGY